MELSIIIPAYNESAKILRDLEEAKAYLVAQGYEAEVLIVDDGSRDDTAAIVKAALPSLSTPKVKFDLLSYGENRGKGYAVRYGILRARGKKVLFMDAGLCVPLTCIPSGMKTLDDGADVAIGSRRVAGAKIDRAQPVYRQVGSKVFGKVVRGAMGIKVSDTQCGFKLYTADAAKEIFSKVTTEGFMFDIEALLIADKLKMDVREFGVEWSNDTATSYHPLWGTLRNFKELARIRVKTLVWSGA